MKEEKTIFIRCSIATNDLLEDIRKAEMPPRSRNSEIIYLIHKEAERLGMSTEIPAIKKEEPTDLPSLQGLKAILPVKSEASKLGLSKLAETKKQETPG